jgi:predicted transcriptional regulator
MRTTISLEDDVHQLASLYAAGRGLSLSAAINEAVRKLVAPPAATESRIKMGPNGFMVFAATGRVLTPEMVKAGQEDDFE